MKVPSENGDMTPEQVLAEPPRVLTQEQRESYFESGYVSVESLISQELIDRLNEVTAVFVERSRSVAQSGEDYDVADDHGPDSPKIRRLKMPDRLHETYWEFATGLIADVAADLVGSDVVFHHSKLNFKWDAGSDDVKWHQDIQFYPHTNYSPLTIGTYLADTGMDDGPPDGDTGQPRRPPVRSVRRGGTLDSDACPRKIRRPSMSEGSSTSPDRPARSLHTTAVRSTARRLPPGRVAGPCCSTPMPPLMLSPTRPILNRPATPAR